MELPKSVKGFALVIILLLIVVVGGIGAYVVSQKSSLLHSLISSKQSSTNTEPLFGTMIAFSINDVAGIMTADIQNGWTEFRKDNSAYQNLLSNFKKLIPDRTKLVKTTGFSLDRASFVYFTWNVIEPKKGRFDWGLTDLYAPAASNAGMKISAVIQPFASWDQKNTQANANCMMLDAAYYDYKAGPPNDLDAYKNFLTKIVERYKSKVAVWEVGNEPDAECNGYQNNPQGYFDLLKASTETIKKVDPEAKVTNGGASGHFDNNTERNFWTTFFQLGGGRYIDYYNFHYNTERSQDAKLNSTTFLAALNFFNSLMDKNGGRKPLYLTEFGFYSGSPSSQPPSQPAQEPGQNQTNLPAQPSQSPNQPLSNGKCGDGICDAFEKQNPNSCPQDCGGNASSGNSGQLSMQSTQGQYADQGFQPNQGQTLRNVTENEQAVLYFKDSILAFANGTKIIFIDLIGPDSDTVGSSMAFNTNNQPRLFLATLKMIESKISGFSDVEKIADGQYKFTVGNKTIYALWSGALPNEVFGKVKVTDIKGQGQTVDAAAVKLNATQPIFLEPQK